jgi:hypothetical protein
MTKTMAALVLLAATAACRGSVSRSAPTPDNFNPGPIGNGAPDGGMRSTRVGSVTLTNVAGDATSGLAWVGFQDGDGPWQTIAEDGRSGTYGFDVTNSRYGLAFVCDQGDFVAGELIHTTLAELNTLTTACDPAAARLSHHLQGAVRGADPGATIAVFVGGAETSGQAPPAAMGSYDVTVPAGSYDVVAVESVQAKPTRVITLQTVRVTADTTADLDFAPGASLVEAPVTVTGADGPVEATLNLTTDLGAVASWSFSDSAYRGLAARDLAASDIQELTVSTTKTDGTTISERGVVLGLVAPQPVSVELPPAFSSAKISTAASAPYLRPRLAFDSYPSASFYQLITSSTSAAGDRQWLTIVSAGWLGGQTSYDFPDLSAAAGFQATWAAQSQDGAQVEADAVQSTRDFSQTIGSDHASSAGARLGYAKTTVVLGP